MTTPRHDHDELHYAVSRAAIGLSDVLCGHGDPAVTAELHGRPCRPGALPDTIDTLIPRCGFAHMIGSLLAQIHHHEGPTVAERFRSEIRRAESDGLHHLRNPRSLSTFRNS
ncbi:MAG TPA: hypothetical protein VIU15_38345 [Streptomyces sp.]